MLEGEIMKNIRFLSVVMLLISVFLCASYGYATTEQKNEKYEGPQKIILEIDPLNRLSHHRVFY